MNPWHVSLYIDPYGRTHVNWEFPAMPGMVLVWEPGRYGFYSITPIAREPE